MSACWPGLKPRKSGARLTAFLGALSLTLIAQGQTPGTLDPSFPDGSGADSFVSSVALLGDGRVLVGGLFSQMNGTSRFGVASLNASGTVDTTFGNPGVNGTVWALAPQADQKVVIGGTFFNLTGALRDRIARLGTNGTVDLGYLDISSPGANNGVYGIALQPVDGKALVCGYFTAVNDTNRNGLARLNADGNLDLTYTNLLVFTELNPNPDTLRALVVQPGDSRAIIAGKFRTTNSLPRTNLARLNLDGSVDTTFTPPTLGGLASLQCVALQPDGKILVGGEFNSVNGTGRTNLFRLNTNGTLDASFLPLSFRDDFGGRGQVMCLAPQSSGQILVGGYFSLVNGVARTNLVRLNSDGSVDATFSVGSGPDSTVRSLAVQPDNWVILAGDFSSVNGSPRGSIARVYAGLQSYEMCSPIPLPPGRTVGQLDAANPFTVIPANLTFQDLVNKQLYPTNPGALTVTWNFTSAPTQMVTIGQIVSLPTYTSELGLEIAPPPCADTNLSPDGAIGAFWHGLTHKLYATAPGASTVTWRRTNGSLIPQPVLGLWPTNPAQYQTHVAGSAPVGLTGSGSYASPMLLSQDPGTGASVSNNNFTAANPGKSLLLVSSPGASVQLTNIFFQFVQSIAWNDPAYLQDTNLAVIGEEIVHPAHDPACGAPYALDYPGPSFPPRVCVEPGYYNRTNRTGPIIPVNRSASGTRSNDLLLVLYQFGSKLRDPLTSTLLTNTVAWPHLPVRYLCTWPSDPDSIFIAGGQGSGPVQLPDSNWSVYRQPNPGQPGYNPNEEHAFRFPAAPRFVELTTSASSLMVAEGSSVPLSVTLVGDPAYAPQSTVTVSVTGSREGDTNIYVVFPSNAPAQQLEFTPGNWSTPQMLVFAAGNTPGTGSNTFVLRASGGLFSEATVSVRTAGTNASGLVINPLAFDVPENGSRSVQLQLASPPPSSVTVTVSNRGLPGDSPLLQVQSGAMLVFTTNNWNVPQNVVIQSGPDADSANDVAVFSIATTGGLTTNASFQVTQTDVTPAPDAAYALRNDLGDPFGATTPASSEPYVLLKYTNNLGEHRLKVFKVLAEDAGHRFEASQKAGQLLQPPNPLTTLPKCPSTVAVSGPYFHDRNGDYWAKAAGISNGLPAETNIVLHYFYKPFPTGDANGFDPSPGTGPYSGSECLPWLDQYAATPGTPVDFTFTITWPDNVPELRVGETLIKPKFGLPNIANQCSVDVIYEQTGPGTLVQLYEPLPPRVLPVNNLPGNQLPAEIVTQVDPADQKLVFMEAPVTLRKRIKFNPNTTPPQFEFQGYYNDSDFVGEPLLLPNVMTAADAAAMKDLSPNPAYQADIDALRTLTLASVAGVSSLGGQFKALSAASPAGSGYVALAMQNSTDCGALPVGIEILKVTCPLYQGDIKPIYADCAFDETLTLRHSADFAGRGDDYVYQWFSRRAGTMTWSPESGQTNQDLTIRGPGLKTLEDYEYYCHYQPISGGNILCGPGWSPDTIPALAEGWIKRVVGGVNPFSQITTDFHSGGVNTVASMIQLAGPRWEGSIALNCLPDNQFGLIPAYETVLNRGIDLSIGAGIPLADDTALRLAAGQLADLYMLLGNEAYGDAQDPTIGFGTGGGQYTASSIHCFQGQSSSLLQEELILLRGRDGPFGADNSPGTRVDVAPVYNRLYWNFGPDSAGETAYVLNYNITDQNASGTVNATDAALLFPQGHGDAWGHYLSAINSYYRLFANSNYTWVPEIENVNINGANVQVNYQHERKFAKIAAARARTAAEILSLTYRSQYVEDPAGQWQGYRDADTNRAWGVTEWACRGGQAALFDWLAGNALLPDQDLVNPPLSKVDRTTVSELREVAASFLDTQQTMDVADQGLNPLGLDKDVVPFGIDPGLLTAGQTYFEQIYARAVAAMNNAIAVFNHANEPTQLLRQQQDSLTDFQRNVNERLNDFTNRLIEIFGYPYNEDIGGGGAYPIGYVGPDLYHFNYVDVRQISGVDAPTAQSVTLNLIELRVGNDGTLSRVTNPVPFNFSGQTRALVKPANFTTRLAPGELQRSLGDLLQARTRFDQALVNYNNLVAQIDDLAQLIQSQFNLNAEEIFILNTSSQKQRSLNELILADRETQMNLRTTARVATLVADAYAEFLPTSAGFSFDPTSTMRGSIRLAGAVQSELINQNADEQSLVEQAHQQAKEDAQNASSIELTSLRQEAGLLAQIAQLEQLVRQESVIRYDLLNMREAVAQAAGTYAAVLARGNRVLEDRVRFLQQTAAQVQAYRYKDMAFRIFRNDALQKYRAQFDLAARYVYLAAKAYDYETGLLQTSSKSGSAFLEDIVRKRAIGTIQNGTPLPGGVGDSGLAAPMAAMQQNYSTIKANLGINNQITRQRLFSLRNGWFRISNTSSNSVIWRETLRRARVDNIWDIPEYQRYCRPLRPEPANGREPAIVISFPSTIIAELNFFGWPAGGGDSAYNASLYSTKILSVGLWFSSYDSSANGLVQFPSAWLVPVGEDVVRAAGANDFSYRHWKVFDQKIPVPNDFLTSPPNYSQNWIPINFSLNGEFAAVGGQRQYSTVEATTESQSIPLDTAHILTDSGLIGRSVWNTQWMLIIPGVSLLGSDPDEGLERFIAGALVSGQRTGNGVTDIKVYFQTYSYSGF